MQAGTKKKIQDLVAQYRKHFPEEYDATVQYLKSNRKLLKNELADLSKEGTSVLQRGMYEIPETLDNIFLMKLKAEEQKELETKEGSRWFMAAFPEFKIPEKI